MWFKRTCAYVRRTFSRGRLLSLPPGTKGYKVAIAEQMEDPKLAKGLVKREVIRVVTPGTITSAQALDETKNNYLMGIVYLDSRYGIPQRISVPVSSW